MIEGFKILTITHKKLNAEDLAHFVVRHDTADEKREKLIQLRDHVGQDEMLYLATCNRVIYLFYGANQMTKADGIHMLHRVNTDLHSSHHQSVDKLVEYYSGEQAIKHLFEVAASIDSLVIGEREIFRQFREAYAWCHEHQLAGDNMRLLEKSTVKAAKDVYTNTGIGAKPVSVVSLAIQEFLKKKVPTSARILIIGAGETNTTVGRFLKKHGYQDMVIFNRSFDNALQLSQELGARAMHLADLEQFSEGYDCIFACTAAQEPIVNSRVFDMITRDKERKVVVDLSIPHNVSTDVASHDQVDYISVDSVRALAEENLRARAGNIAAARIILHGHIVEFSQLLERRRVERAFGALPTEISKVKERALTKVYKDAIDQLPSDAQALIHEIASYMEKKCVAVPMKMARESL